MKYILLLEYYNDLNGEFSFLRKEPKYLKPFKHMYSNAISLTELKELYSKIVKHKNTLKQNNIDLSKYTDYETYIDMLAEMELTEKFNKFTKLLPNRLRNEVRNDAETHIKFKQYILDFKYDDYKNNFLKKVAKIENVDQLFNALDNYLGNVDKNKLKQEIENQNGARIWYEDENFLIAIIFSKEASCNLGSSQWCISNTNMSYWDSYVGNKSGVQYFVWDFSKKETDPKSKIGITVYSNDYTAHDKIDDIYKLTADDKVWSKTLKKLKELDSKDKFEYLTYNLTEETAKKLTTSEKRIMVRKNIKNADYLKDLHFFTETEILEILEENPKFLSYHSKFPKLHPINENKLIRYIINDPTLYGLSAVHGLSTKMNRNDRLNMLNNMFELDRQIVEKEFDKFYKEKLPEYKLLINGEDEGKEFLMDIIFKNNKAILYLESEIVRYLDIDTIHDLYEQDKEGWDEALSIYTDNNRFKKYFDSFYERYKESDLYVFIGRYVNKKVGENDRGKPLYEQILEIENMVNVNPLINPDAIFGLKMRAKMDNDATLYQLWASKGMFDDFDVNDFDEYILDLIEERMVKIS